MEHAHARQEYLFSPGGWDCHLHQRTLIEPAWKTHTCVARKSQYLSGDVLCYVSQGLFEQAAHSDSRAWKVTGSEVVQGLLVSVETEQVWYHEVFDDLPAFGRILVLRKSRFKLKLTVEVL